MPHNVSFIIQPTSVQKFVYTVGTISNIIEIERDTVGIKGVQILVKL